MSTDWQRVHDDFPVNRNLIWLNNCGTTPASNHVVAEMERYLHTCANKGPGADPYLFPDVQRRITSVISRLVGCKNSEIALIHHTAEGMTMVSHGLSLRAGDEILLLENEYPSNVYPWEHWRARGVETRFVQLGSTPDEFVHHFTLALTPRVRVASFSPVHWCTGMPLPIEKIAALCHERAITLVIDGSQGIGHVPFDLRACGPCIVCFSAWKWLLGPLGLGVLIVSEELLPTLTPFFKGPDAMADAASYLPYKSLFKPTAARFTYSTPNFGDWVYFAASLEYLDALGFEQVQTRIFELTARLALGLDKLGLQPAYRRAAATPSGILAVAKNGTDCQQLAALLAKENIVARDRMGRLRLAPHVYLSTEQIDQTVDTIGRLL